MKRWLFLIIFCLCWLMFSCSSTPPAEESLPEEVVQEPVSEDQVIDAVLEEGLQENAESVNPSLENSPAEDELLSSVDTEQEVPVQDDFQDYLQEIEIVDLLQEETLPSNTEEDIAVIVDSEIVSDDEEEGALIVEIPSLQNEEVPLPEESVPVAQEDVALVVETVETEAPEEEPVPVEMEGEEVPILAETEVQQEMLPAESEPAVALEQEDDSIPEDINETQGVLEETVVPSRSVVMDNNQYLDIRYPGAGWVYLGEVTEDGSPIGTQNLTYFGRRRTSEDTSFTMKSSKPGKTILHFYKQDVLTATFIDDYLEVTITEAIAQNGFRVIAPSYESIVPEYQDVIPQSKDFAVAEAESPVTESTSDNEPDVVMNEPVATPASEVVPASVVATPASEVVPASVVATPASEVVPAPVVATTPSVATTSTAATNPAPAVEAEVPVVARAIPAPTATTSVPVTSTSPSAVATPAPEVVMNEPVATPAPEVVPAPVVATTPSVATTSTAATNPTSVAEAEVPVVARATPAPTASTRAPATITAPVIVPPQTPPSQNAVARNSSAQVSSLQQEVYEPEPISSILPQDNYNPQTGLSMEDLDLPWVNQEVSADISDELVEEAVSTENKQAQDALLAQAQDYFYEEDYPAALASLDEFFEIAVNDFDAAYYLKGQILESKSPIKNVKEAQKAYKQVIDSYPQSPFWERSKNRYTYLSRFYFDIR